MPNFCDNTITICSRDKEKLERFKSKMNAPNAQGEHREFSFHHHVPRPAEENANWYNWNLDHWGTKWDADVEYVMCEEKAGGTRDSTYTYITIECTTPWNAPYLWARFAAIAYDVTIIVKYREPGCQLCGTIISVSDYYYKEIQEPFVHSEHSSMDDEFEIVIPYESSDDDDFPVTVNGPVTDVHSAPAA